MKQTAFIFGRTPQLSFLELQSFYPQATILVTGVGLVEERVDADTLMHLLGGSVKIVELLTEVSGITEDILLPILTKLSDGKHLTFGISGYGGIHIPMSLSISIKKTLAQQGISARYIETKSDETISSVVISKQQVVELVVISQGKRIHIGVTRAVQNFEDWNKRDFGRPAVDPKAGMLPPKVARMIVNIALAGASPDHHPMLVDPYCGVGTVLAEGLLRGANVTGSDLSEAAVEKAKKNIEWLRSEYAVIDPLYSSVLVADATHLGAHLSSHSVDAMATEPFMGEPVNTKDIARLTPERVKNILKGLEKLYIGSLREWATILKPGARIVMAMPSYALGHTILRVKKVVDRCESLGYTLLTGPIEYSRPQAVVRREFFVFQKK